MKRASPPDLIRCRPFDPADAVVQLEDIRHVEIADAVADVGVVDAVDGIAEVDLREAAVRAGHIEARARAGQSPSDGRRRAGIAEAVVGGRADVQHRWRHHLAEAERAPGKW